MNERIKELFAKTQDNDTIIASKAFGHWPLYEEDLEKFAELIIAECTDLVQKYTTRWPEDCELTKQIKEHFGITND